MRKVTLLLIAMSISSMMIAQDTTKHKKPITDTITPLTETTPLLTVKDVNELNLFLQSRLTVTNFNIVIQWLNERIQQKALQFTGKSK